MQRLGWLALLVITALPTLAGAQEAPAAAEATPAATEPATADEPAPAVQPESAPAASSEAPVPSAPAPALAPKVVVVVSGDPDEAIRGAASQLEERLVLDAQVRMPADENLRAALRGATGSSGDGLDEVRRERQRLGLGEAEDAPILQRLGRRAGAVLVVVVRASEGGAAEAVTLDVRSGQFFEGIQSLGPDDAARSTRFVARRAATASGGAAQAPESSPEAAPETAPVAATAAEERGDDVGHWFEQNWAYFAAGGLLVAAIIFVAVTATGDSDPPPMVRFQPGGL